MRATRYWQLCALLPLLLPVAAIAALYAFSPSGLLEAFLGLLLYSLLFGGLPYLVFAIPILLLLRGQSASAYQWVSFVVPMVFAILLTIGTLAVHAENHSREPSGDYSGIPKLFLFFTCFGYLYTLIANLGYWLISSLGLLDESSAA